MKHNTFAVVLIGAVLLAGCTSNPNRAEKIDTSLSQADSVGRDERVGVHGGEMVVQSQVMASERLRDVQNRVYALEDQVYGTRKLGSQGLFGQLRTCKRTLASKAYGGDGTLTWTEPLDRITDKEEEVRLGLGEKQELIGLSREYLRDRLTRFLGYKMILQKRADEFTDRVEACRAEIQAKQPKPAAGTDVVERDEVPASTGLPKINAFMCGFVRRDASLKDLLLTSFARGWLSLTDFKADQNLIAASLKDKKGRPRQNVMLFNGWKLAFDQSNVTLGDLFTGTKDAKLTDWAAEKVADSKSCLAAGEGVWNP